MEPEEEKPEKERWKEDEPYMVEEKPKEAEADEEEP